MQQNTVFGESWEFVAARAKDGLSPGVNSPLTAPYDTSGSGRSVTLSGFAGTTSSGYAGSGTDSDPYWLGFAGDNDYLSVPSTTNLNSAPFTFDLWYNPATLTTAGLRGLIVQESAGSSGIRVGVASDGRVAATTANGGGTQAAVAYSGASLAVGTWSHICVRHTGSQVQVWVDGVAGTAQSSTYVAGSNALRIGYTLNEYAHGRLAVARRYPWALTDAEMAQSRLAGYVPAGFSTLKDGGLSLTVRGDDITALANDIEWESNLNGAGWASWWSNVADPFYVCDPAGDFSNLMFGAPVVIDHTLYGVTTNCFRGWIINDPRSGYSGEVDKVTVECGGPLEVMTYRDDLGFVYTDCDPEYWVVNKRNNKAFDAQTGDSIYVGVSAGTKIPNNKLGIVGYVPYLGADHLRSGIYARNGVRRFEGSVSARLPDNMRAGILKPKSNRYTLSRDLSDYDIIKSWGPNAHPDSRHYDTSSDWSPGAGGDTDYLVVALWCTRASGTEIKKNDAYIEIDNPRVYTTDTAKRIDQAMISVADFAGLHNATDTAEIGNVLDNVHARFPIDGAAALTNFSAQATQLVDWGYFVNATGFTFRARPLVTGRDVQRLLTGAVPGSRACYAIDGTLGGRVWDVSTHPEDGGGVVAVRLLYGKRSKGTLFPAGTPASVMSSGGPGLSPGTALQGATAPVMTVDFSENNYTDKQAKDIAVKLSEALGLMLPGGPATIDASLVRRSDGSAGFPATGGTDWPAPYMQGGSWLEEYHSGKSTAADAPDHGPLLITRCHVKVEDSSVDLELGLDAYALIEQLEAAGHTSRVAEHPRHKRKKK